MLFSKKGKLKKEFDEQLINQFLDSTQELRKAQVLEDLSDDYEVFVMVDRKIAESKRLFLLKEARIRKVRIQ